MGGRSGKPASQTHHRFILSPSQHHSSGMKKLLRLQFHSLKLTSVFILAQCNKKKTCRIHFIHLWLNVYSSVIL